MRFHEHVHVGECQDPRAAKVLERLLVELIRADRGGAFATQVSGYCARRAMKGGAV